MIKSKQGKLLTTLEETKDRWIEHFSDLLNISVDTDESILEELDSLPVKHDLDHQSPGPDGILPEILVYGGPTLKTYLLKLFTTFKTTESLPADLVNPNLTVLFKKGDRAECGNYPGISLLSTVGKLLADILLQRLQNILPDIYPESQHGYRSGRSTIDGIFTVPQIMEKSQEQ